MNSRKRNLGLYFRQILNKKAIPSKGLIRNFFFSLFMAETPVPDFFHDGTNLDLIPVPRRFQYFEYIRYRIGTQVLFGWGAAGRKIDIAFLTRLFYYDISYSQHPGKVLDDPAECGEVRFSAADV
ncbi:MAG: hypothetical protein J5493_01815 [Lachnospiraceae bacterium]|nr:hypothetical protein [Lachnospiraceae bacterium]